MEARMQRYYTRKPEMLLMAPVSDQVSYAYTCKLSAAASLLGQMVRCDLLSLRDLYTVTLLFDVDTNAVGRLAIINNNRARSLVYAALQAMVEGVGPVIASLPGKRAFKERFRKLRRREKAAARKNVELARCIEVRPQSHLCEASSRRICLGGEICP